MQLLKTFTLKQCSEKISAIDSVDGCSIFGQRILAENKRDCYRGKIFCQKTESKRSGHFLQKLPNYWTGQGARLFFCLWILCFLFRTGRQILRLTYFSFFHDCIIHVSPPSAWLSSVFYMRPLSKNRRIVEWKSLGMKISSLYKGELNCVSKSSLMKYSSTGSGTTAFSVITVISLRFVFCAFDQLFQSIMGFPYVHSDVCFILLS